MTRPVSHLPIDLEIVGLIINANVLLVTDEEQQLAVDLGRDYARWLMGHRDKSPEGDKSLSIMQNQFVRSEVWYIVQRHGYIRRQAEQWRKFLEDRGRVVF